MWKNIVRRGRPYEYMAHAYCMLDTLGHKYTHPQVLSHSLLLHSNNGCTAVPHCYVICTLHVLLIFRVGGVQLPLFGAGVRVSPFLLHPQRPYLARSWYYC